MRAESAAMYTAQHSRVGPRWQQTESELGPHPIPGPSDHRADHAEAQHIIDRPPYSGGARGGASYPIRLRCIVIPGAVGIGSFNRVPNGPRGQHSPACFPRRRGVAHAVKRMCHSQPCADTMASGGRQSTEAAWEIHFRSHVDGASAGEMLEPALEIREADPTARAGPMKRSTPPAPPEYRGGLEGTAGSTPCGWWLSPRSTGGVLVPNANPVRRPGTTARHSQPSRKNSRRPRGSPR